MCVLQLAQVAFRFIKECHYFGTLLEDKDTKKIQKNNTWIVRVEESDLYTAICQVLEILDMFYPPRMIRPSGSN